MMAANQAIAESGVSLSEASVASVNGDLSVVLSGSEEAVTRVLATHVLESVAKQKLDVSHAFHSPLMACVLDSFRDAVQAVSSRLSPPSVRMFSTLRGAEVSEELTNVEYWLQHVDHPVLYKQALESSWESGGRTFVEMGPNGTLTRLGRGSGLGSIDSSSTRAQVATQWQSTSDILPPASSTKVPIEDTSKTHKKILAEAVAKMRGWVQSNGVPSQATSQRLAMPLMSRKRYSLAVAHQMLQETAVDAFSQDTVFKCRLHKGILNGWLADHILHGSIVLPGVAMVELAYAAGLRSEWSKKHLAGKKALGLSLVLEDLTIRRPLIANDVRASQGSATTVWCVVSDDGLVRVYSDDDGREGEEGAVNDDGDHETPRGQERGSRILHAEGYLGFSQTVGATTELDWATLSANAQSARDACTVEVSGEAIYVKFLRGTRCLCL